MNCIEFKHWMLDANAADSALAQTAKLHRAGCPHCETIYRLDQSMESQIKHSLTEIDPPADLYSRIKLDIPSAPVKRQKSAWRWKIVVPALATATIVCLVLLNSMVGQIRNVDQIVSLALVNHLDNRQNMAFKAHEIKNVAVWFAERIGFAAPPPDLSGKGYLLEGGRQCRLGPQDAAYLYYKKNGKRCSLFILNPADLRFKLEPEKKYIVKEKNHDISVWYEEGLVYAMVI